MKLTQEQIEEIRKRAEVGPFIADSDEMVFDSYDDIPALLAHIAELEAQNKKLRETLNYVAEQAEDFYEPKDVDGAQIYFVKGDVAKYASTIQEILVVSSEVAADELMEAMNDDEENTED